VAGNTAGSASAGTGLGGGIFLGDICTGGTCTSVGAILQYVNFTGNYAHLVSSPIYHPHNQCMQNLSMKAVQACRGHRHCVNICTFVRASLKRELIPYSQAMPTWGLCHVHVFVSYLSRSESAVEAGLGLIEERSISGAAHLLLHLIGCQMQSLLYCACLTCYVWQALHYGQARDAYPLTWQTCRA